MSETPIREPRPELILIGERIRYRRLRLRKTQEWVGERLGLTKKSISDYENALTAIPLDQLVKLSKILEVPLVYFFNEENIAVTSEDKEWLEGLGRKLETVPVGPTREFEKMRIRALVDSVIDVAINFTTQVAPANYPYRVERPGDSIDQSTWKQTLPS